MAYRQSTPGAPVTRPAVVRLRSGKRLRVDMAELSLSGTIYAYTTKPDGSLDVANVRVIRPGDWTGITVGVT